MRFVHVVSKIIKLLYIKHPIVIAILMHKKRAQLIKLRGVSDIAEISLGTYNNVYIVSRVFNTIRKF
jgi:queuine/archaeosine tRNA-ribosyltransferase